jgi:hypothetical protein
MRRGVDEVLRDQLSPDQWFHWESLPRWLRSACGTTRAGPS